MNPEIAMYAYRLIAAEALGSAEAVQLILTEIRDSGVDLLGVFLWVAEYAGRLTAENPDWETALNLQIREAELAAMEAS
jgi:hypothetical protein